MKDNNIKELNEVEHVLKRPGLYIGSYEPVTRKLYLYERLENKFKYQEVTYIPGLLKIIREVIDNCIDEGLRTDFKFANRIKINIDKKGFISIEDNGRGIPFKKTESNLTMAELAWCHLRAGSNFNDEEDSTTLGQNGVGVSLTHIFSKKFIGESCSGTHKVKVESNDNMNDIKTTISKGKKKFTRVAFLPDYKRFGVEILDEVHEKLLYNDLVTLGQIYPKLEIVYNSKSIQPISFKDFSSKFSENVEILENDNIKVAIFPNETDDFNFYHNINGLNVVDGGNPLNWVIKSVLRPFELKLQKKFKQIKSGDIKNKISAVVIFKGMVNPRFNSQTKENCINTFSNFSQHIDTDLDFEKFINNKLYKNKFIINPIIDVFKIKQEYEDKKALKDLKPELKKRVVIEKYLPASKKKEYLVLAEGDSALGGISAILGREHYGYFPLKGKPLNIKETKIQRIRNNEEIKNILQILKFDVTKEEEIQTPDYEKILIATDADADGSHITGLLILLFYKFMPNFLENKKLYLFKSPLVVAKRGSDIKHIFFTLKEYNEFKANSKEKLHFQYYKGLGTWKKEDLKNLIKKYGKDKFILPFNIDCDLEAILDTWFSKDNAEDRKELIQQQQFDIEGI